MIGSAATRICFGGYLFVAAWLILARILRQRYPILIPHSMTHLIHSPFRRMVQPLYKYPQRLAIKTGLTVLDIGPRSRTYTRAPAKAVGPDGKIVALDIEDRVIRHIQKRIRKSEMANIEVYPGDARSLKFPNALFEAIYGIAFFGEIPDRCQALVSSIVCLFREARWR
jgi:protein-L-isoaspartate O-methyltransferase